MYLKNYDGGIFEVEVLEEEQPINFTVNVTGNVNRIGSITIGAAGSGTTQNVVEGANSYSMMASTDYVMITTANGGEAFYQVDLNGTVKNATWNGEGDSGYWGYTYSPNTIKDGDVINIKTDGDAETKHTFTITNATGGVEDYKYIQSLSIVHYDEDGNEVVEPVELNTFNGSFEVNDGYNVKMTANVKDYYYAKGDWTITQNMSGTEKTLAFNSGAYNQTIKGDTELTILAKVIDRNKSFTLSYDTEHYTCAVMYNGTKTRLLDSQVSSGMVIGYGDVDFPIMLWLTCTDSSASSNVPWLYMNDELKDFDTLQFYLEPEDYAGSDNHHTALPNYAAIDIRYAIPTMSVNVNDAAGLKVTNVEVVETLANGDNSVKLRDDSNADDKKIHFEPQDGYVITSIRHNGNEVLEFNENMSIEAAKALSYAAKPQGRDTYVVTVQKTVVSSCSYDNGMTQWDNVYVLLKDADGHMNADQNPGALMTMPGGEGDTMGATTIWTYSYESLWTPTTVEFGNGDASTGVLEFENGKQYGEAYKAYVYASIWTNNDYMTADPFTNDTSFAEDYGYNMLEDGCMNWTIKNWNGDQFACMVQDIASLSALPTFFGGAELVAGEWIKLNEYYGDPTDAFMSLPEAANGNNVSFSFNTKTNELSFTITPVMTIAEAVGMADGVSGLLGLNNAKVTYDLDGSMAFVEDETGAMQVGLTTEAFTLTAGTTVTGQLEVTKSSPYVIVMGGELTSEAAVIEPKELANFDDVIANANRYVKFTASDEFPIAKVDGVLTVGGMVPVLDQFGTLGDYEFPKYVSSVAGILYVDLSGATPFAADDDVDDDMGVDAVRVTLVPLKAEDIEAIPEVTIAGAVALTDGETAVVGLNGAKVTFVMGTNAFVEDETGAMLVGINNENVTLTAGTAVTGQILVGKSEGFIFINDGNLTAEEVEIVPTELDDLDSVPDNTYRYVKITAGDDIAIENDGFNVTIANRLPVYDYFCVLGDDYAFPEKIASVAGILFVDPYGTAAYAEGDDDVDDDMGVDPVQVYLVPLKAADVVEEVPDGINGIAVDGEVEYYNLQGLRVVNPTKGVYIVRQGNKTVKAYVK